MKCSDIDQALRTTFEIEGLLLLLQQRDDNAPEQIECMIAEKISTLSAVFVNDKPTIISDDISNPDLVAAKNDAISETSQSPCHEVQLRLEDKIAVASARQLRRALTINDRYRFCRELFDNSNEKLNSVLDALDSVDTFEQAKEHLAKTLEIDMDNDTVKDFLDIVAKHFNGGAQ